MPQFDRIKIVIGYIEKAEYIHKDSKRGLTTYTAKSGKHKIVATVSESTGILIGLMLDKQNVLAAPNLLNAEAAQEALTGLEARDMELNHNKTAVLANANDKLAAITAEDMAAENTPAFENVMPKNIILFPQDKSRN